MEPTAQQIVDWFYLGADDYVKERIAQISDAPEAQNVIAWLQTTNTAKLITAILDKGSSAAVRRNAWVELRAEAGGGALRFEAAYALGLCDLDGQLAATQQEFVEQQHTVTALTGSDSTPASRTLALLYLLAVNRPKTALKIFPKIEQGTDSGLPEIAQIWVHFIRGAYNDAMLATNDAEDYLGLRASGRTSSQYMENLRGVCALHAGEFEVANKCLRGDRAEMLVNRACCAANRHDYEAMDECLNQLKDSLGEEPNLHLKQLSALEIL